MKGFTKDGASNMPAIKENIKKVAVVMQGETTQFISLDQVSIAIAIALPLAISIDSMIERLVHHNSLFF